MENEPIEHFFKVLSLYLEARIRIRNPHPHQSDNQVQDPQHCPQLWLTERKMYGTRGLAVKMT
jgi:hypothetical protein